ncbi:MAG: topoisomerase [Thermoplasmata archaeon]|nr:MAG: topoisomerase [Thermoplasmata archaeon]
MIADALEELEKTIDEMIELNKSIPVIVEGDRDVAALRRVGVVGKIIVINTGLSIEVLCETIAREYDEVIILTDWDRKGGMLARRLRELLLANGTKCNESIRAKLSFICKRSIKDVESLPQYIERLREEKRRRKR